MLSVGWLILIVVLTVLLTAWITFTITRLDRLHARVDAAQSALDAQLVRRVAAMRHAVESQNPGLAAIPSAELARYDAIAQYALTAAGLDRQPAENEVGRAVADFAGGTVEVSAAARDELHESAVRVAIARRFYNDAVRDTRALRNRRMPRVLHLAGYRDLPQFFDIDDTVPPEKANI